MKALTTEKSASGLRDMLFAEMDDFRNGKSSPKRAQIVVNFAREIINASKLEIIHASISAKVKSRENDRREKLTLNL
jgi:hypothetical protein